MTTSKAENVEVGWLQRGDIPPPGDCGFVFIEPFVYWKRLIPQNTTFLKNYYFYGHWITEYGDGLDKKRVLSTTFNSAKFVRIDEHYAVQAMGNMRYFDKVPNEWVDGIACVYLLDYVDKPWEPLSEMWRCLKSGGTLFVSFLVTKTARYNHTIDKQIAETLISRLGEILPKFTPDSFKFVTKEDCPRPGEDAFFECATLMFCIDKPKA